MEKDEGESAKERHVSTKDSDTRTVGYYAVGLFDLLGQSSKLAEWKGIPHKSEEVERFLRVLKDTAGRVKAFRETFIGYFKGQAEGMRRVAPIPLTDEQQREYDRIRHCNVRHQQFSDTVVLYTQLSPFNADPTSVGIYAMLGAAAMTALFFLSKGVPIRGAIEVGLATDALDGEIYGPALDAAYQLEQKVAQYPRVVVGNALMGFIQALRGQEQDTPFWRVQREMATRCHQFLVIDQDGVPMVDFLGKHFREQIECDALEHVRKAVDDGLKFVRTCHDELRISRDWKLAGRYSWLRRYYETRAPEWAQTS